MGAQALKGHDTLHSTAHWAGDRAAVAATPSRARCSRPDGNLPHIRSKIVGLSFDTGEVPGGEYFLTGTNGFADVAPDLAGAGALLALRGVDTRWPRLRDQIVDGELQLDMAPEPGAQHAHRHRGAAVDPARRRGPRGG